MKRRSLLGLLMGAALLLSGCGPTYIMVPEGTEQVIVEKPVYVTPTYYPGYYYPRYYPVYYRYGYYGGYHYRYHHHHHHHRHRGHHNKYQNGRHYRARH